MDILEHPLEAFAFRLYTLPDASAATGAAAWTCLAAVVAAAAAAAAGLWRLRASTPAARLKPLELDPSNAKDVPPWPSETASPSTSARTWTDSAAPCLSPKERYTAYYCRDVGRVGCCDSDEEDGEEVDAEEQYEDDDDDGTRHQTPGTATDPFGREVVRSLPLGPTAAELGRYRRSPTTVSGSVVRLWDEAVDDAGVAASPRRRSRVVAVGAVDSAF